MPRHIWDTSSGRSCLVKRHKLKICLTIGFKRHVLHFQRCQFQWQHQGGIVGICPPVGGSASTCPHQKKKNGQNQAFSANFWIFAPSESPFAPSMPPTKKKKKFWCSHWPVFRFLPEFRFFVSPNLHVFIHFQPIFGCFGSNLCAFSGFSHQFQVFWVGLTGTRGIFEMCWMNTLLCETCLA